MIAFSDLLKRMKDDTENQLRQLESGRFKVFEQTSEGEMDRTAEQMNRLRGHIKELEEAIKLASRSPSPPT